MNVKDILKLEFKGEVFTRFAVMTWADRDGIKEAHAEFTQLIADGHIVEVSQAPLGARYKMADPVELKTNFQPGDKVEVNGYEGVVKAIYSAPSAADYGMYEVRLASGVVCVCGSDID